MTFIPTRGQLIFLFYTRGKNFRESSLSKVRQTVKQRSQIQVLYSFLAETISKFKSCLPRIVRQTGQMGQHFKMISITKILCSPFKIFLSSNSFFLESVYKLILKCFTPSSPSTSPQVSAPNRDNAQIE